LTTVWSVVAQVRSVPKDQAEAWDHIYKVYSQPVADFLRLHGQTSEEAEETTQRFFAWLWEKEVVARADRTRGRFRNFLLTALKQFVARDRRYQQAAKRCPPPSEPIVNGASTHALMDVADPQANSADRIFDRSWAIELLQHAIGRLRAEYQRAGQELRFDVLSGFLTGEENASCDQATERLGLSASAVRVAVHRLRKRFGQVLREEIRATVASDADVDDEIRALFRAIRGGD
jgi:DNA-directed RNA polymerase specialized sigma24 family protein